MKTAMSVMFVRDNWEDDTFDTHKSKRSLPGPAAPSMPIIKSRIYLNLEAFAVQHSLLFIQVLFTS